MNKIIAILLFLVIVTIQAKRKICRRTCDSSLKPFYRYWNSKIGDHFYTTNVAEIGVKKLGAVGKYGYKFQGLVGYISKKSTKKTTKLYRYWNPKYLDHFYTTTWSTLKKGKKGYKYRGVQGYLFKKKAPGYKPLYRYWNKKIKDHFYTQNKKELGKGKNGWRLQKIESYVKISRCTTRCKYVSANKGCLKMWEHYNFGGKALNVCGTKTIKYFHSKKWNDKVSSVCAGKGNTWVLYQHAGKQGMRLRIKPGQCRNVPASFNDQVSYVEKIEKTKRKRPVPLKYKWGKCGIVGDPHFHTPKGKYDLQATGDMKAAQTENFVVHVRTKKWSRGTSVTVGVAIKVKGCNTKIVYFGNSRLYLNRKRKTVKDAQKESKCVNIKRRGRWLYVTKGGETIRIYTSKYFPRRPYSKYYQHVYIVGKLAVWGTCGGPTRGKHTAKGLFKQEHRRRTYKIVKGKCYLKHKNAAVKFCHKIYKGVWDRRSCVFDRCHKMKESGIKAMSKMVKKMKYWIRYFKNKELHHTKRAAKYLALYKKHRKKYIHHASKVAHHYRMTKYHRHKRAYHESRKKHQLHMYKLAKRKAAKSLKRMRKFQKLSRYNAAQKAKYLSKRLTARKAYLVYKRKMLVLLQSRRNSIVKFNRNTRNSYRIKEQTRAKQYRKITKNLRKNLKKSQKDNTKYLNKRLYVLRKQARKLQQLIRKTQLTLRKKNIKKHMSNYVFLKGSESKFRSLEKARVKSYYAQLRAIRAKSSKLHRRNLKYRRKSRKLYKLKELQRVHWFMNATKSLRMKNKKLYKSNLKQWSAVQKTYSQKVNAASKLYHAKLKSLVLLNRRKYYLNKKYYFSRSAKSKKLIRGLHILRKKMLAHLMKLNRVCASSYRKYVYHKNLQMRYSHWAYRQKRYAQYLQRSSAHLLKAYKRSAKLSKSSFFSHKYHSRYLRTHRAAKSAFKKYHHLARLSKTHSKLARLYKAAHKYSLKSLKKSQRNAKKVTVFKRKKV